jgi:ferredoxin
MANQKEYPRSKADSKLGKIVIDRDLCIGAASCIAVSGQTYQLDGENKAVVTNADLASDEEISQSAQSCPTKAILLFDKEGKKVFPQD